MNYSFCCMEVALSIRQIVDKLAHVKLVVGQHQFSKSFLHIMREIA